jgi:hypothetical protein
MLYTRFHAIRKRRLLVRMTVIGAVLAGLVPLNGQQPAGSATQDPSATSEPKQNPTTSSTPSTKNNPNVEVTGQDSGSTFGLRVNLVQVHVVVRDANSNLLAHLKQEDFQLFDQGKLPPINLFARQARREKVEAATGTQVAEFIALMFDDSHISLDDATCFRQVVPGFLHRVIPH